MSTELAVIVTVLKRPHIESRIVNALDEFPKFPRALVPRVHGSDRGRGAGHEYSSTESDLSYHEFIKLKIDCEASSVRAINSKIVEAAWTGRNGDGVRQLGARKREGSA